MTITGEGRPGRLTTKPTRPVGFGTSEESSLKINMRWSCTMAVIEDQPRYMRLLEEKGGGGEER